ncbi:MAG: peptide-methionine (S)-S-oxide reductase [Candidatus Andersenbacteria bacterium RIFCSPHIGHO2_02_FULL_45_11]|uniref:Peptide methionine sulfoxide reductase MsrA n=1 Tax=Candidatus Andersenbacteria bacterium RIFCSPHIGHO2_12_FULL_45_11 TaxID=1797281 RepID=A0A1G1X096_9BACT|nr:MAG: peptide-methionine (S)-S-oxide reductase [Candidatus Andersenbacteria bacterium RIFCSPHIGHO2_02_FULL_45_11]OGY33435.1 MAG: peptide-methionine (S)-S-oxide reductase [Candidatus Andersenbacteria bacterium RIFCSPHIGHO2_12_FULL_45_11]
MDEKHEIVAFGGGCFWCTEAVFSELRGVASVMPGYTGGLSKNPTYDQVCSGTSGHAEVIKIEFDPSQITFNDLLTVFFATHEPTTLNRQGNDVGTQYRSSIFYTTEQQEHEVEKFIADLNEGASARVVTEIASLGEFYPAEEWHREYYFKNSDQPYCQLVISPKLERLQAKYSQLLKSSQSL